MSKTLIDLPPELLLLILDALPISELVSCRRLQARQLTHFFLELIEGNSSIQYKIELAAAGIHDGIAHHASKIRKLKMLQQYQLARNTMRDELVQKLDMPTCDVYDLCGTLAIYVLGNKLTCIIPASRTKATPERRWSIEHDAGLKYCCCDTQQDLLILVELEGEVRHVHLRTLSTNDPHPLARNAAVLVNIPDVPGLGEDSEDTHARIFGDYLALQYIIFHENDRTHFYTFTLLRWKTSETIHSFEGLGSRSFVFVDPEHIALAFDGGFLELIHVNHRTPKLILELPRISNMEGLDVSIRSDERPPIWEPNDDIFYVSRHESLLLIDVLVRNFQGDGSDGEYRIIVPTWKLRTLLNTSIASERKEWSEWGPQNTMGFHIQQFESSSWSSVFGSRYLTVESERLVMYDFNRYALRPPVGDTSDELAETDLLTSKVSEVYAGPLPHRKYYTSQMIPAGSNVAMAEGFVVEYHMVEDDTLYQGTIIAF